MSSLDGSVAEVALGYEHSCARKTDGTLWCWGDNFDGELGDGTMMQQRTPVQISSLGNSVAQIALGGGHTCARKTDGTLWCWGYNQDGQLGDGTMVGKTSPVQVSSLGNSVAQIAVGGGHTCARKTDDTLWCWGNNTDGQLGDGTMVGSATPVQVSSLGSSVAQVALGSGHSCARKTDDTLWCWGANNFGAVGNGSYTSTATPVQVSPLSNAVAEVALGELHSCARKTDDTLWCWGFNDSGQLGVGTNMMATSPVQVSLLGSSVAEVALGGRTSCARKTDDSHWCWGSNDTGQLDGASTRGAESSPVELGLFCQ